MGVGQAFLERQVDRRDHRVVLLQEALASLLWFHPLAWRVRETHAAACDAVCDAIASRLRSWSHSSVGPVA